ncbi:hypothetical protein F5X99DRAFT_414706 [Biscogniauxia marginata]|nr:hypothetical protein F5X99DRAFT_414706 [Biscogniauxia marginata]
MAPKQPGDHHGENGTGAASNASMEATLGQNGRGRGGSRVRLEGSVLSIRLTRRMTTTLERPSQSSAQMPPTPTPRRVSLPIGHFPGANRTLNRSLTAAQSVARRERFARRQLNYRAIEQSHDLLSGAGRSALAGPRTPTSAAPLTFEAITNQSAEGRRVKNTSSGALSQFPDHSASPSPMQRATQSKQTRRVNSRPSSAASELAPGLPTTMAQQPGSIGMQQPATTGTDFSASTSFAGPGQQNDIGMEFSGNVGPSSNNHQVPTSAGGNAFGVANNLRPLAPAPQPATSTFQPPGNNESFVFGTQNPANFDINMNLPAVGAQAGGAQQPGGNFQPHAGSAAPYYNVPNPAGAAAAQGSFNNGPSAAAPNQFGGSGGASSSANAGNLSFNGFNSDNVPHSTAVSLPNDINAAPRTGNNPYYYSTGFAPAYQIPPVPVNLEGDPFHYNPYARPGTWSAYPDPNQVLPVNVYESLRSHMIAVGVCNNTDQVWIEGVQYGIGLAIEAYKESLLDEIEVEGRVFGRALVHDNQIDSSLTMRNRIADRSTAYYDRVQAAKAASKFVASSNLLAEVIVEKGLNGGLPAQGGFVATEALFPNNPDARAHTNALNAALAAEHNGPPHATVHAEPRPLVGAQTISQRLPEYEGVSQGAAQNIPLAAMIDNAIDSTKVHENVPNFAVPVEDFGFTEEDLRQMTGAAAFEVASRHAQDENYRAEVNDTLDRLSGAYDQPNFDRMGEVSSRTTNNRGAQPRLSETDDGLAFISYPENNN